jgi:GTP-binding protein HflX
VNFGELIRSLEDEFAKREGAQDQRGEGRPRDPVHVAEKSKSGLAARHAEESLRELAELARTAGVDVVDTVLQVRDRLDPRHVMGKGKLDEVVLRAAELDAHTLIFDHDLTPSQAAPSRNTPS